MTNFLKDFSKQQQSDNKLKREGDSISMNRRREAVGNQSIARSLP
jgi:hypothetical protein